MMVHNRIIAMVLLFVVWSIPVRAQESPSPDSGESNGGETVKCANLVYGTPQKTSRCFADKFLKQVKDETRINAAAEFTTVLLGTDELFDYPFAVMTGEGNFTLSETERDNLKRYVEKGGFLLASAGCSDPRWADSFEQEMEAIFAEREFEEIRMDHEIFATVHQVEEIRTSRGTLPGLQGLKVEGRLALVYSPEGLNDTGSVKGCCCCGGNEVRNSLTINVNIFAYALTH